MNDSEAQDLRMFASNKYNIQTNQCIPIAMKVTKSLLKSIESSSVKIYMDLTDFSQYVESVSISNA